MPKKSTTLETEHNVFKSYFECIKKYCQFKGRLARCDYWSFVLVNFIIGMILGYMEGIKGNPPMWSGAYSIFVILPSIAAQVRRLHDTNHSGWWLGGLLIFVFAVGVIQGIMEYNGVIPNEIMTNTISVIALIWVLVLLFFYIRKGTAEENKYGE